MKKSTIVRLDYLDIEHLGNVEEGHIDLDNPNPHGNNGSVLGVYGQNGTGKSTLVQALYLIRQAIQGESVGSGKVLSAQGMNPKVKCGFQIWDDQTQESYSVSYDVLLRPTGGVSAETLSFSYQSPQENMRKTTIIDTMDESAVFSPKIRRANLVRKYSEAMVEWWQSLSEKQQLEWAQRLVLLLYEKGSPAFSELTKALVDYAQMTPAQRTVAKRKWPTQFSQVLVDAFALLAPDSLEDFEEFSVEDIVAQIVERSTSQKMSSAVRDFVSEQKKSDNSAAFKNAPMNSLGDEIKIKEQETLHRQVSAVLGNSSGMEAVKAFTKTKRDLMDLDFMADGGISMQAQRFRLRTDILDALQQFGQECRNETLEESLKLLVTPDKTEITSENSDEIASECYKVLTLLVPGLLREIINETVRRRKMDVSALLGRVQQGIQAEGRSFVFSPSMRLWAQKYLEPKVGHALDVLYDFAMYHWYIFESLLLADSMNGKDMVLHFPEPLVHPDRTTVLDIPLVGSVIWKNQKVEQARKSLRGINAMLSNIMPDAKIDLVVLNTPDSEHSEVELHSVLSDGSTISLTDEAAGVKRMISIVLLLAAVYYDPSTTVVIDELDAFLFEHLLGMLLAEINQSGVGQLIFTSHNLHLLEVLGNRCIVFTEQYPEDRYVRINNIKATNNLRDVYLKMIESARDDHPLFKPLQRADIHRAFAACIETFETESDGALSDNG